MEIRHRGVQYVIVHLDPLAAVYAHCSGGVAMAYSYRVKIAIY